MRAIVVRLHISRPLDAIRAKLILPNEEPGAPVAFTVGLVAYVGGVCLAAVLASTLAWRPTGDFVTLTIGVIATAGLSAYAVRTISGLDAAWSASGFVQLAMSLSLGPPGAVAGAVADGLLGGALLRGWFKCAFNTATFTLSGLSAWGAAQLVPYHRDPRVALLAGFAAGAAAWVVNHVLFAIVIAIASRGQVPVWQPIRGNLGVLRWDVAYGWAAAGAALLYGVGGAADFPLFLAPVIAGQAFLVQLARRIHVHQQELQDTQEAERRRIARDLHDTVVQVVAGSSMTLAAYANTANVPQELLQQLADELRDAARDLRTLIVQIAPPTLEQDGLATTLGALVKPLRDVGISVEVDCPDAGPSLEHSQLIFRVAQEALRNIQAHAEATSVRVTVFVGQDDTSCVIEDNGKGFSPEDVQRRRRDGHVGTRGIAEVAKQAGGELTIESSLGSGTCVRLTIPRHPEAGRPGRSPHQATPD